MSIPGSSLTSWAEGVEDKRTGVLARTATELGEAGAREKGRVPGGQPWGPGTASLGPSSHCSRERPAELAVCISRLGSVSLSFSLLCAVS